MRKILLLSLLTGPRATTSFTGLRSTNAFTIRLYSSTNSKNEGHSPPANQSKMSEEETRINSLIHTHQTKAVESRLPFADAVRTLVHHTHGYAVISTNSQSSPGFPTGSVVGFAPDDAGRPIFLFSTMSGHTNDLLSDDRCGLCIADKEFKGAADGRVSLLGKCAMVHDEVEVEKCKEIYLKMHPDAFWVGFGDFKFYRMNVDSVRFVGGFAMAGGVSGEAYASGKVDIIKEFSSDICKHMNDDHASSTMAIVLADVGEINIESAKMASVDARGMEVVCMREGGGKMGKLRIPFDLICESRADVKERIVGLTMAAAKK